MLGLDRLWTDFGVLEADGLPAVKQGSYPIRRACGRSTLRPSSHVHVRSELSGLSSLTLYRLLS